MSGEKNDRDSANASDSDENKVIDSSIFDNPPSIDDSSSNNGIDASGLPGAISDDVIVTTVEEFNSTESRKNVSIATESICSTLGGKTSKEYSVEVGSLFGVEAIDSEFSTREQLNEKSSTETTGQSNTDIEGSCDKLGSVTNLEDERNKTSVSTSINGKKNSSKSFTSSTVGQLTADYSKTLQEELGISDIFSKNPSKPLEASIQQERKSYGAIPKKRRSFDRKTNTSDENELSPENRPSPAKKHFAMELSKDFPESSKFGESVEGHSKFLKDVLEISDTKDKKSSTALEVSVQQEKVSRGAIPKKPISFEKKTKSSDESEQSPENRPMPVKKHFATELSKDFPESFQFEESAAGHFKFLKENILEMYDLSGKKSSTPLEASVQQEKVSRGAIPKIRSSFERKTSSSDESKSSPENHPSPPKRYFSKEWSKVFPEYVPEKSSGASSLIDDVFDYPKSTTLETSDSIKSNNFKNVFSSYYEEASGEESGSITSDNNNNSMEGYFPERILHKESERRSSNDFMKALLSDFPEKVSYSKSSLGSLQESITNPNDKSERMSSQETNLIQTQKIVQEFFSGAFKSIESPETVSAKKKSIDVEDIINNILNPSEKRPSGDNAPRSLVDVCPRPRHPERRILDADVFRQRFDEEVKKIIDPQTLKALYGLPPEVGAEVEISTTSERTTMPSSRPRRINWPLVYRTAKKVRDEFANFMILFNNQNPPCLKNLLDLLAVPSEDVSVPSTSNQEVIRSVSQIQEDITECVNQLININSELTKLSFQVFTFLFKARQMKNFVGKLANFKTDFRERLVKLRDIHARLQSFHSDCCTGNSLYGNYISVKQICFEIIIKVYQILSLIDEIEAAIKS